MTDVTSEPSTGTSTTTSNNVVNINKGDKDGAEIGVEYGIGPILPGSDWNEWASLSADGEITNRPVVTIDQVVDMRRRDGQAKALMQLVMLPLRLALQTGTWVEPEEGGAGKETEFANQMWSLPPSAGGMTTSASKFVRQALLSVVDGFAAFEIVRTVPKEGPLKNKITAQKLAYRDPRTIRFKVDKHGGYRGFRQITKDGNGDAIDVTLAPLKTLVFTQHDELNPHYGVSLFESAYPHFDAKRKLYYIAHLAAQFAAVPGRVGEIPAGAKPTEVLAFRQALINFAFNAAMIVPAGYKVTPFNGHSGYDFLKLIDHHNTQMSKSVLAGFFDNDQRTVLIENTTQDASADLFLSNIQTISNDIAENMTHHLMPQFIDWNFGTKKYPVFKPGPLSDQAKVAISELFKNVVTAGILNSTPEMVRELEKKVTTDLGLDIDYDEIEAKEKEAAEQKAAMEAEQQQLEQQAQQQAILNGQAPADGGGGAPPPASTDPTGPATPQQVAASQAAVDEIVKMSQRLFINPVASPVDDL